MESLTPTAAHALDTIQQTTTHIRILTPHGILEGEHAHPAGVRLSDSLRNAASHERYLMLTNVTLRQLDGSPAHDDLACAPFVLVNAAHAQAIIPLGEATERGSA
jgi:hypothetical protein